MLAFAIYLMELWLLLGLIIALHSQRNQIGLVPLFFMTVGLIVLLNFSNFINVRIQLTPDITLGIAGHVFAPIVLVSMLIVYIVDGVRMARMQLLGLISINILTILILLFVFLFLNLEQDNVIAPAGNVVIDTVFLRRRIASIVAFTGATVVLAIIFQFCMNRMPNLPIWFAVVLAFIGALLTDSFLFFLISDFGLERFIANFSNDLMGKLTASIAIIIPLAFYFTRTASSSTALAGQSALAILFGEEERLDNTLRALESELRVNRRIYQELTQNIGEIFWMADAETHEIIYISPAFEQITGYKAVNFYRHFDAIQDIIHPEDRLTKKNMLPYFYNLKSNEFRIIHADGSVRWMRNRTFSIASSEPGKIYRYAGVIDDITEGKLIQQNEFDLFIAQERMKILNDFIRDASHDLKSPLNSILLKLEYFEKQLEDSAHIKVIAELKDRTIHLNNLIDDLFTLSRIEGNENVTTIEIDLNKMIEEMVHQFQPIADSKKLDLVYLPPNMNVEAKIRGNKEQLSRVVGNLISNAIRYTNEGKIQLMLSNTDHHLQVTIKDTGIGIPEDEIPRIFERFYRSSNTRNSPIGTGLGLAIVKAIVESYHGTITVQSTVNEGSTFTVLFPC